MIRADVDFASDEARIEYDPALAALAMATSSVSVVTTSLAFAAHDPHEEYRPAIIRPLAWLRR